MRNQSKKALRSFQLIRRNVVFIGHVNSGKSTLAGHLLYKEEGIDQRIVQKYETLSAEMGKEHAKYAWIHNRLKAERERGVTINISQSNFKTYKYFNTLIDTPGHRDYIKNMIIGTSQADLAILVVSAVGEEFDAAMSQNGQTREHILLAYTFGIKQLIVCVNKIESVNYDETVFEEIKSELSLFLKRVGYNPAKIPFVPVSALGGECISERTDQLPWYDGQHLSKIIDDLDPPNRLYSKPLRIPIQNVYKISGIGTVVVGIIQTGALHPGMLVSFALSNVVTEVKTIEMHNEAIAEATAGDYIGFNVKHTQVKDLKRGDVASCYDNEPAQEAAEFTAQVIILNHPGQIKVGYTPVIDCHTTNVACRFSAILKKIDRRNGAELEEAPEFLKSGDTAIVTMVPTKPMCVEAFNQFPPLGRFSVRDHRQTVGVGVIKSVTKKELSKF